MSLRRLAGIAALGLLLLVANRPVRAQVDLTGLFQLQFTTLPDVCLVTATQTGTALDLLLQCIFIQAGMLGTIDPATGVFAGTGGCMVGPGLFGTLQMDGSATSDSSTFTGGFTCPPAVPGGPYPYIAKRLCPAAPAPGCRDAGKSLLLLKNETDNTKDKLLWKWLKGAATTQDDFGVPTDTTGYTLCLYAGSVAARAIVPPSASRWRPIGSRGWKYDDTVGAADGITKLLLKGGVAGKAKIVMKGKRASLPPLTALLPVAEDEFPLTVQLTRNTTNMCWESTFEAGDVQTNTAERFQAKQ
jgi:hypothetical protein